MNVPSRIAFGSQSCCLTVIKGPTGSEGCNQCLYPRLFGAKVAQTAFVVGYASLDCRCLTAPYFDLARLD
jgi:hypothetical protein